MRIWMTYAAIAMLLLCGAVEAQHRVRIGGLEDHAEYRALVAEEEALMRMSDSVTHLMNRVRGEFRVDTLNRNALSAVILRMEEEMFDIRNRTARITGRINAIEKEWILLSLEADPNEDVLETQERAPERQPANLVYNSWFERNLRAEDLRDLRRAQDEERSVPPLVERYRENHTLLTEMKQTYDLAPTADLADSVKTRFDALAAENRSVERSIADTWARIFDNKSYAYGFVMDKNNRTDLLQRYESDMDGVRNRLAELRGVYASDVIPTYYLQKRLITRYELLLAQELGNDAAVDSLGRVLAALPDAGAIRGLDPVVLTERLFLDFSDITIHSSPQYDARHPIPELRLFPGGIVYRVLLGTYLSAQQPSVFRGVAPLAVQRGDDGRFRYFAGGFASEEAAADAVDRLTRAGFRRPEPVVWMDGVYINLATGRGVDEVFYRIEISGVRELSPEILEVIRTATQGRDILRTGDSFVVGPIHDAREAARLRLALDGLDPEIRVILTSNEE